MSDDHSDVLEALRLRERELEIDAAMIRARCEEVRSTIATLTRPRRPGRPRRVVPLQHPDLLPPDDEGDVA